MNRNLALGERWIAEIPLIRFVAGTWASAPTYWTSLSSVYESMLAHAGSSAEHVEPFASLGPVSCPTGELAISGDYALPLEQRWYDEHPDWFSQPHHDYPAVDIPVPVGTPLFAVTNGVVVSTPTGGRCGAGVVINGDDRAQYTYCHGQPGTQAVSIGDRVTVWQYLLDSASTGNSTGPHLHLGIETDGARRCPQTFLVSSPRASPSRPRAYRPPAASAEAGTYGSTPWPRSTPSTTEHAVGTSLSVPTSILSTTR